MKASQSQYKEYFTRLVVYYYKICDRVVNSFVGYYERKGNYVVSLSSHYVCFNFSNFDKQKTISNEKALISI